MKRCLVFILVMVVCITSMLTGCTNGGKTDSTTSTAASTAVVESNYTDPGTFPIVKEKVTLKFLAPVNAQITNMSTNEMTKYMEEKTNIHIEFEILGNLRDAKPVILASGDLPDVFFYSGITKEEEMVYGPKKAFVSLNDYIDKYSTELKKILEANPRYKLEITAPDQNIYSLPQINETYHTTVENKMWVNSKWLKNVGLNAPTTTEEFYQMLKAFKTKDPNGNKKNDDIPLTARPKGDIYSTLEPFLMSAFITDDGNCRFVAPYVPGKLDIIANKPEYKQGLEYISKLYKEGLVDPEAFTQDEGTWATKGESDLIGASPALSPHHLATLKGEMCKNWDSIKPLIGPNGLQSVAAKASTARTGTFVITSACKDPEAAFRYADWLYSEEALYRGLLGVEGQSWEKAKADAIGINGKPAVWQKIVLQGAIQNYHWNQMGPSYRSFNWRLSETALQDIYSPLALETRLYQATKNNYTPYGVYPYFPVDVLYIESNDAAELAKLKTALIQYMDESFAKFVSGNLSLEKDWDTYVKTLNDLGLARFLELYQKAYDTKFKGVDVASMYSAPKD